jgi:hypothetical protein
MASEAVAEWVNDGFLHPIATLTSEFVDVDEFLRIPVDGLTEIIQFARVRVGDAMVIIFGPTAEQFRSVLENKFRVRHPDARQVFLASESSGLARVRGSDLAEVDAIAVAVTQFRCAWDESAEIQVGDDRFTFLVAVTYQNEKYFASARMEPSA